MNSPFNIYLSLESFLVHKLYRRKRNYISITSLPNNIDDET